MRKKAKSEGGLTLVEMLCAVVILILLGLLLNTGLQMAVNTYRTIVAQSEVELLLSTAVDALTDDLRYARNVKTGADGFTYYDSDSYGKGVRLAVDAADGQIKAYPEAGGDGIRVLSTGAYGPNKAYRVTEMKIEPAVPAAPNTEITFTIKLKIETTDGKISTGTPTSGVTVRCLNPK